MQLLVHARLLDECRLRRQPVPEGPDLLLIDVGSLPAS
jgi:hypothetical protein